MTNTLKAKAKGLIFTTAALAALGAGAAYADEVFELRLVHNYSTTHYLSQQAIMPWVEQVEQRSNGRLKIRVYPASQLGKEQSNLLRYGLADLALIVPSAEASRMPLSSAIELPIDLGDSCEAAQRIWDAIGQDQPLYREELKPLGMKPLFAFALPPYAIMTTNRPVQKMEDLTGMKLRANGGAISKTMRQLDVVPLSIASSEMYDAMSRGTIDGAYLPLNAVKSYSLQNELDYIIEGVNLGSAADYFVASDRIWRELPDDLRTILMDAGRDTQSQLCRWFIENEDATRAELVASGIQSLQIDEKEAARWTNKVDGAIGDWIETMESRNRNGRAVVDSLMSPAHGS